MCRRTILHENLLGKLEQPALRVAASDPPCTRQLPALEVHDLSLSDCPQPGAEAVTRTVAVEVRDVAKHGLKHVLANVSGVGRLQSALAAPLVHQGAAQAYQAIPCSRILGLDSR
jgi:hypothetical protein